MSEHLQTWTGFLRALNQMIGSQLNVCNHHQRVSKTFTATCRVCLASALICFRFRMLQGCSINSIFPLDLRVANYSFWERNQLARQNMNGNHLTKLAEVAKDINWGAKTQS